jgi:hypothetical protein
MPALPTASPTRQSSTCPRLGKIENIPTMGIALTAESRRREPSHAQAQFWTQAADDQRIAKAGDHSAVGIGVNLDRRGPPEHQDCASNHLIADSSPAIGEIRSNSTHHGSYPFGPASHRGLSPSGERYFRRSAVTNSVTGGEYLTFRTEGGVIRADAPQQVHMHGKAMMRKNRRLPRISKARLEEMTEQATVDAYSESEQITGWFTMIEENLGVPFETTVLGVPVTVEGVDLNRSEQIVAVCKRGRIRQSLPILDLPLPTPLPVGAEWIEAYRRWRAEDD